MESKIDIHITNADIVKYKTDALALKYAQENYGLDMVVSRMLEKAGYHIAKMHPKPGSYKLLRNVQGFGANILLFMGVVPLYNFGYREIRHFSRSCLTALAREAPEIETLALTLHGVGYGLDESEAFESELAGLLDAISTKDYPPALKKISIVERNTGRCERLKSVLKDLLPANKALAEFDTYLKAEPEKNERLRAAGYASDSKPHVFVAMPFKEDMDDVYHYGIQGAVKEAGFLCERADMSTFTGDVMQWVKDRISSASLIVADLTDANPNVYLEVGYAWGCGKPTVLLTKDTRQLKFDVRSQRCVLYKKIKDLEISLAKELSGLLENGEI